MLHFRVTFSKESANEEKTMYNKTEKTQSNLVFTVIVVLYGGVALDTYL